MIITYTEKATHISTAAKYSTRNQIVHIYIYIRHPTKAYSHHKTRPATIGYYVKHYLHNVTFETKMKYKIDNVNATLRAHRWGYVLRSHVGWAFIYSIKYIVLRDFSSLSSVTASRMEIEFSWAKRVDWWFSSRCHSNALMFTGGAQHG